MACVVVAEEYWGCPVAVLMVIVGAPGLMFVRGTSCTKEKADVPVSAMAVAAALRAWKLRNLQFHLVVILFW